MKLQIFSRVITALFCAASVASASAATFSFTGIYQSGEGPGGAAGNTVAGDISGFPDLGLAAGTFVHGRFSYDTAPPAPTPVTGRYFGKLLSLDLPGISFSIPNPVVSVFPGFHEMDGFDFALAPSAPVALPSAPNISALVAIGMRTDKPNFGPLPPTSFALGDYFDAFVRVELSRGEGNYSETYMRIVEIAAVHTPVPAALPLFATGLGLLGLFAWRRRRKTVA